MLLLKSEILNQNRSKLFLIFFFSSYQGWDNPFRPEGELSADAEEILRLWKEGKPLLLEAEANSEESEPNSILKSEKENNQHHNDSEPLLSHQNGMNGKKMEVKSASPRPQPSRAEKVNIEDEPKKKQGCCSLM